MEVELFRAGIGPDVLSHLILDHPQAFRRRLRRDSNHLHGCAAILQKLLPLREDVAHLQRVEGLVLRRAHHRARKIWVDPDLVPLQKVLGDGDVAFLLVAELEPPHGFLRKATTGLNALVGEMRELNLDGFERSVCVLHGLVAERKNEPIVKERFESIQRRLVPDERPGSSVDHEVRTTLSGASAEGVALPHFETAGERAHLMRVEEVAADGNPAEVHRALVAHDRVKRLERLRRDEPRTGGAVGVRSNHTLHVHGRGELNANLGRAGGSEAVLKFHSRSLGSIDRIEELASEGPKPRESRTEERGFPGRTLKTSSGSPPSRSAGRWTGMVMPSLRCASSMARDGAKSCLLPSYASAGQALCFARLRMMVLRAGVGYRPPSSQRERRVRRSRREKAEATR